MSDPAKKRATYEDIYAVPENMIAEIIDGELTAPPRPSADHVLTASALGGEIVPPFQLGRGGGPGGWVILDEPEIKFGENLLVPDMAGWRKERFPGKPAENWFSIAPDWICEILSPSAARRDRVRKMPIYAENGLRHVWLIDPALKTLEAFRLESGKSCQSCLVFCFRLRRLGIAHPARA